MALDFPSNPVDGQVYDNYFWDATTSAWRSSGSTSIPDFLTNATISTALLSDVPLRVDGVASQAASLQEWRNSSGTVLSSMSASGGLTLNNALTVGNGGTGATALSSGAYLKGNGSNAIQAQIGIPAGDITSGTINFNRLPAGSILQSIVGTLNTPVTSNATSYTSIGLQATITPLLANSKILAVASMPSMFSGADSGRRAMCSIFRGSTNIAAPTSPGSRSPALGGWQIYTAASQWDVKAITGVDLPNSTSALTYSVMVRVEGTDTIYINRNQSDTDSALFPRGVSVLTLFEIKQ